MLKTSLGAAFCSLLLVTASPAAAAPDAQRMATMVTSAAVATGEMHITYDKVTVAGDDVTFANVKLRIGADNILTLPTVLFSSVVERPGGGFTAKRITFNAAGAKAPEGDFKWATAILDDVIIPGPKDIDTHAKIRPFRKLTLTGVSMTQAVKTAPITLANLTVDIGEVSDTAPTSIRINGTGAKMPVAFIANPIGNAMISRMGYTEFEGTLMAEGSYDTAKNNIAINSVTVDAAKVGKLQFSAKLSNTSLGGIADPDETAEARAAARLDSLTIRFDDAGFVGKMLDMQADLYGGSKEEVRDALVFGALPLVLNYVQNAAFRDQFQDAADAFLANPKNFTITATPPMPVPLGEVLRTALQTPLKLPDLLSPKVSANK
jgi:hypothetical protein